MKFIKYKKFLIAGTLALVLGSCKKSFEPSTAIDENSALTTFGGMQTATIGNYARLRGAPYSGYARSGHFLMEYPGDEVAQGQVSSDDLSRVYRYTAIPTSGHPTAFWRDSYFIISATNKIIAAVPENASTDLLQLKGENLFLRALLHFNLVRIFGRPYTQNDGDNPGVPILKDGLTDDEQLTIARSKVSEVYDFVIEDLLQAEQMMTVEKTCAFATKEAAEALLAKVYLYKEDNAKAIEYADKVISSGRYDLLQGNDYANYFRGNPEANSETIFCVRFVKTEDQDFGSIGSMYFSGDASGKALGKQESGWAEIYASEKYWNFLNQHPNDLRRNFISPYTINGVLQYNDRLNPKTPMYYVNKFNLQEGIVNLSSPVYLRLAEMYLIRAEANAKLGNAQQALDDLNIIRDRAGIPEHTLASIALEGKTALDVTLEERWLELAFEGNRAYDLFRNNRPVERNYPGTHALNSNPANVNQTVQPTEARVIFFIPESEIAKNPNLTQNP